MERSSQANSGSRSTTEGRGETSYVRQGTLKSSGRRARQLPLTIHTDSADSHCQTLRRPEALLRQGRQEIGRLEDSSLGKLTKLRENTFRETPLANPNP